MKTIKVFFLILTCISILSCTKDKSTDDDNNPSETIPEALHVYFNAPSWKREIDCSKLVLEPIDSDESNYFVKATSESTNATFMLSYPNTATELAKAANIKTYPVSDYGDLKSPFQFALLLPKDAASIAPGNPRIASNAGNSSTEYTEIVKIERVKTVGASAVFEIQGKYAFNGRIVGGSSDAIPVKGTFRLQIYTQDK